MPKKLQQIKSRRETTPPKDSSPEFIGSLRSQRNVVTEWKLKRDLKTCNSQIGYWERKLTTAQEGVTRWTAQISAGQTGSYSILQGFVKEVGEAKDMITGFKEQAAISEAQIDALLPDAAKAA